jgi:hypothetical protein
MKPSSDDRKQQGSQPGGDPQQQEAASGAGGQYGEGNYQATRDYNKGLKEHIESHDVEREARDAEPRDEREAKEMDEAERIGRGKARAKDDESPDAPEDQRDLTR